MVRWQKNLNFLDLGLSDHLNVYVKFEATITKGTITYEGSVTHDIIQLR